MVNHELQDPTLVASLEQSDTKNRTVDEIERFASKLAQSLRERCAIIGERALHETIAGVRGRILRGYTVLRIEAQTQRFMPLDQPLQGTL